MRQEETTFTAQNMASFIGGIQLQLPIVPSLIGDPYMVLFSAKLNTPTVPNYKQQGVLRTKSHLIRAITRPRPTTPCSGQLAVRQKAVMKREKAGSRPGICLMIIIGNASLYFGTVDEEFQRTTIFFKNLRTRPRK
jgi:hypothetical protein